MENIIKKTNDVMQARERKKVKIGAYKLFWIFMVGCVAGVLWETILLALKGMPLESRSGLIYGPFNPVYGFGAVLLTEALKKINPKKIFLPLIIGAVLGGGFEYISSLFQELAFGTVSWDYSSIPFNFGGRTNILYALVWGILGILWVKYVYPFVSELVEKIHHIPYTNILTIITAVFMAFNMFISASAVYRQSQRDLGFTPQTSFGIYLDQKYPDSYLDKIYPNMIKLNPVLDKSS